MNIIQAIKSSEHFRPMLQDGKDKIKSWENWTIALRCLYGLPIKPKYEELVKQCTGRSIESMPEEGFDEALFLVGRRGGKSRIASIIGSFEATFTGKEDLMGLGEKGMVSVISPSLKQSRVIDSYLRAVFDLPEFEDDIVRDTRSVLELENKVSIECLVGDFRRVRGYTMLAALVDELAFMGLTEESKVKSDTELIRAVRPALATTKGKLISITTPYAKKGYTYRTYKDNWGNPDGKVLIWMAPTRTMNRNIPQGIVDDALKEDLQAAKSEWLAEFREDIIQWLDRSVIESAVIRGRKELIPFRNLQFFGFVDVSGGRRDSSALCIGHKKDKVVVDYLVNYKPPHNPYSVVGLMAAKLKRFRIGCVVGDNYSASWVENAFRAEGIRYERCKLPKSQLYLSLLPIIGSNAIELLDDETLISQLAGLERRTRSGGKDTVDHSQGGHDDSANTVAGLAHICSKPKRLIGGLGGNEVRVGSLSNDEPMIENLRILSGV